MSNDCYCDYDPPKFHHREIRRARKQHKCCECGGTIMPGEQYEHVRGKWDDVATFDTCERCHDIWMWTQNNIPCLCWEYGNRIENCRDAIFEGPSVEADGMRFGFLRRLVMRDKHNRRVCATTGRTGRSDEQEH